MRTGGSSLSDSSSARNPLTCLTLADSFYGPGLCADLRCRVSLEKGFTVLLMEHDLQHTPLLKDPVFAPSVMPAA